MTMNYVKFHIDMTGESLLCRMSIVENETVSHIAGPKEIQKEA